MGVLKGKSALVVGVSGTGCIGAGIARALCGCGAKVMLVGRSKGKLRQVATGLEGAGGSACFVSAGSFDDTAASVAVDRAVELFGGVDVLVNATQVAHSGTVLQDSTLKDFQVAMETGPFAAYAFMKACLPQLERSSGCVVNLVAATGTERMPGQAALAAAKAATRALSSTAAAEWEPLGVRVNCLAALAQTSQLEKWAREYPQAYRRLLDSVPGGRFATLEEVGDAAAELCAGSRTGCTVEVTGAGAREVC